MPTTPPPPNMLSQFRRFVTNIMWVSLGGTVAVCSLVCYTAPYISPRWWSLPAFAGLFYPLWLILQALLFALGIRYSWRLSAAMLVCGLLGYNHLQGIYQWREKATFSESDKAQTVRLMTYNTALLGVETLPDPERPDKAEPAIQFIDAQHPDILCVQEVGNRNLQPRDFIDTAFAARGYRIVSDARFSYQRILSKLPIMESGDLHFPNTANGGMYADVRFSDSLTVRVLNVHLQSIKLGRASSELLDADKLENEREAKQFYGGVYRKLYRAFVQRSAQVALVQKAIKESPYPVIVCGDFNDTPSSYAYHTLTRGLNDAFREGGAGYAFTYAGNIPFLSIDHIFTDPRLVVRSFEVVRGGVSDHYPVIAVVSKVSNSGAVR